MTIKYIEVDHHNTTNFILNTFHLYNRSVCIYQYLKEYSIGSYFDATQITTDIYLGNIESSYNYEELKKRGITHIISCITGYEPPFPNDFHYIVINALDNDDANLMVHFDTTFNFIDLCKKLNGKILIHCMMGRSRSVCILIAYLIKETNEKPSKLLENIKKKRNIVEPNTNFLRQLDEYYFDIIFFTK